MAYKRLLRNRSIVTPEPIPAGSLPRRRNADPPHWSKPSTYPQARRCLNPSARIIQKPADSDSVGRGDSFLLPWGNGCEKYPLCASLNVCSLRSFIESLQFGRATPKHKTLVS